jgi:hypothetical protein
VTSKQFPMPVIYGTTTPRVGQPGAPVRVPDSHAGSLATVTAMHRAPLDRGALSAAPRLPWDVFYNQLKWEQGEHVGLIGPTGQGKTTLLISLLNMRNYVAVFGTKPRDKTMDALIASGYVKFPRWESIPVSRVPRRVIWPDARQIDMEDTQRKVFHDAYAAAYREGGWAIVVDEGYYMSEVLALKKEMRATWTQGRSLGLSHVVSTQRPAWVPTEMYDQSTHLFFWRNNDDRVIRRIGEIGTLNAYAIRQILPQLEQYQCLYMNTRTGQMVRTRAPAPPEEVT